MEFRGPCIFSIFLFPILISTYANTEMWTAFDGTCLQRLSRAITTATSTLLEVVNYNIAGQQYVCAGHVS